ncbi:MAG: M23 family metallopeptidase, partial [Selenomonadaceae bacterium]|nr:M23 family metallopeptidase [Selenomonadaceae bacterium]
SITSVKDAEALFNNGAEAYVKAQMARAKADAYRALQQDNLKKQIQLQQEIDSMPDKVTQFTPGGMFGGSIAYETDNKAKDKKKAELAELTATIEKGYADATAAEQEGLRILREAGLLTTGGGGGGMIWPLSGPITSEFGWRVHPITGTQKFHSGIDIGGDYGEHIHAAASGVVTDACWISGYGYTVIIDHGGGVTTLYGHNQGFAVSVGQTVSQGETIAYCGSTGNSTGPHCHFEVRVNGSVVSPYGYL